MRQATVVAFNVISGTEGKKPKDKYVPHWIDGGIKLTLGLVSEIYSMSHPPYVQ